MHGKKRVGLWLCLLIFVLTSVTAGAEIFSLAGYDESDAGHVWAENLVFSRMEERTGISFTFTQYDDWNAWTAVKAAMRADSDDLPEVLFKACLSEQETLSLYDSGVLIDLRPYLEANAPNLSAVLKAHPDWEAAITLPDGAIVALPMLNELPSVNGIWVNRSWLDQLGLSMPTTAEEFKAMLIAFRDRDPNQNGRADEIPMTFTGLWDLSWLSHAFGFISDDYHLYLDENGTLQEALTDSRSRAFITWLHELWDENLIDHNGFSSSETLRAITDSNATITYGVVFGTTPLTMLPSSAMDSYELMMPLTCDGQQLYRGFLPSVTRGTFALTSACKDPAAMVAWVDTFYGSEGSRMLQVGLPGVEYELFDDGSWNWISAPEEVTATIMPQSTLSSGAAAPCLIEKDFQLALEHSSTHSVVAQVAALDAYATEPMPIRYVDADTKASILAVQGEVGSYATLCMNRFITGDVVLTDETWGAFMTGLNERGLPQLVSLWQQVMDQ